MGALRDRKILASSEVTGKEIVPVIVTLSNGNTIEAYISQEDLRVATVDSTESRVDSAESRLDVVETLNYNEGFLITEEGQRVFSGGKFANDGDNQLSTFIVRGLTEDDTPIGLNVNGDILNNLPELRINSLSHIRAWVVGKSDSDIHGVWILSAVLKRTNAGVSSILGSVDRTETFKNVPAANNWNTNVIITSNRPVIEVTGDTGDNVRWMAYVRIQEIAWDFIEE